MNWTTARPWVGTVARLVVGITLIWASLSKLHDPRTFVQAVRAYDATPEWLSKAIGYGLPTLELCIGILLVVGVATRFAATVAGLLFVVFLIGLIQAAARNLQLTCGCFGGGGTTTGSTSYTLDILRDLGLLVLAVFLVLWSVTQLSVEAYLARHDKVAMPSAKRMRTPEGRRKYEAQLATVRATARSRTLYLDGSIALVVVLIAVIGIGVQAGRAKITGDTTAAHATVTHGVVWGKKAAATVDVYEDPACPICEAFEQSTHTWFQSAVRANQAQARYHVISFLDRSSTNSYSSRAANALYCASDASTDAFIAYHNLIYGKTSAGKNFQPAENTAGPANQQLINLAAQAKLTAAQQATFRTCVSGQTHKAFVEAITEQSSKDGVTGTPTVFVNGKKVTASLAGLKAAVAKADAAGPAPSPSKTPTPSPKPSTPASSAVTSTSPSTPKSSSAAASSASSSAG